MNDTNQRALDTLRDLGERPAAPFHEEEVANYIFDRLSDLGLSPFRDEFGNVIVHYSNSGSDDPPIAFVAHMDHPGFEIDEVDDEGPMWRRTRGRPGGIALTACGRACTTS